MTKKKSPLQNIAVSQLKESQHGVIKLLIADHKLLRSLMKKVKSQKSTDAQIIKAFKELEKSVASHVTAEENTFYAPIKDIPKYEDMVLEGYEEHRMHEYIFAGIHKVSDKKRRIQQMQIYCEMLEHHLDEEEEDLFPRFKKYSATSTRKKMGRKYIKSRKASNKTAKNRGAARFSERLSD